MKIVVILILFLLPVIVLGQNKNTIAVLELDPIGISLDEAKIISSRLRTDLFNTNKYIVLEREKMEDILNEQGFQLSGCTSNDCVVEAGQLLGVKQIVAGNIGKVGSLITLTIRLIDVQSGRILKTATEDCKCEIEDVILYSVKNVVKILSGETPDSKNYTNNNKNMINNNFSRYSLIESKKKSPISAAFLSFLFPGLGQYYVGPYSSGKESNIYLRGILYSAGFVVMGTTLYSMNSGEQTTDARDGLLMSYGLFALISMVDAVISSKLYNSDLESNIKLSLKNYDYSPSDNLVLNLKYVF